ncbi:MAG: ATP-dependent Clp protease ATP-binding subunit [Anaerolineae bacterium]|jgi:ATP-dependent Clp protease ATP-binding subunit ClpC|nr:ATP-dependent Clp protease ATP-binding subunit [Anaerolineae bacterium]
MPDPLERFTPSAQEVLRFAQIEAKRMHHATIGPEHILLGLMLEGEGIAGRVLRDMGLRPQQALQTVARLSSAKPLSDPEPELRHSTEMLLQMSLEEAKRHESPVVDTQHLLLALLRQHEGVIIAVLTQAGLSAETIRRRIERFMPAQPKATAPSQRRTTGGPRSEPRSGSSESVLAQVSADLTAMAREGRLDPVIGRQEEIERVIQILARRTKNNPALIGEPGVGKTAIVEGLAQRIISGGVPGPILGKRLVQLDVGSLVAGTMYRGQFEERLKKVLDELKDSNTIVFIDEVHMLVGAGSAGSSIDAANILKPALARGELQCIGATTLDEYRKHIESDAALERRFQPVMVNEPTAEQTVEILRGIKHAYEQHHRLQISDEALQAATQLSSRYVPERFLPDKAIDVMDEAASRVKMYKSPLSIQLREVFEQIQDIRLKQAQYKVAGKRDELAVLKTEEGTLEGRMEALRQMRAEDDEGLTVGPDDVAEIIAMWTGIPMTQIAEEESRRLLDMESDLREHIVGQDEAIETVAKAVRRARAGLKDPHRPIGSFIFLGPTGVGKTELSKALARFLFGSEEALVQIDMSEFQERHAAARLVGAPPGYVGYDDAGQLTEAIRRRPYSIVVFDEIEKAHPDTFNMLLQMMEEGTLSDARGRKVDFRNTLLIMTTNVGADDILRQGSLGFSLESVESNEGRLYQDMRQKLLGQLRKLFRPEFLNRVDAVVVFRSLNHEDIREIVGIEIGKLRSRLLGNGYDIRLSEEAQDWLAEHGYSTEYGARPLRRLIQQEIETPVSDALLSGKYRVGDVILLNCGEDGIELGPVREPELIAEL